MKLELGVWETAVVVFLLVLLASVGPSLGYLAAYMVGEWWDRRQAKRRREYWHFGPSPRPWHDH